MARRFRDAFDKYAAVADAGTKWGSVTGGTLNSSLTPFGVGQSLQIGTGTTNWTTPNLGANMATGFVTTRHYLNAALGAATPHGAIQFLDGATAQCAIWFNLDGSITLRSGGLSSGTILATYAGAFAQQSWDGWQFKVAVNNTTGSFTARKNGAATDSFAATGLNTRGGTANNYFNVVKLTNSGIFSYINGLYIWDDSGAAPNDWIGDVRVETSYGAADTAQKDFSPSPATYTLGNRPASGTFALASGKILYARWTPTRTGTLTSISVNLSAGLTGHIKAALFADASNTPGAVIDSTAELTNPTAGVKTLAFAAPPVLAAGTSYWIAIWADAAATLIGSGVTGAANGFQTLAYAASFPATASFTTGSSAGDYFGTEVPYNSALVAEATQDGDTSYVFSPTVNAKDRYTVGEPSSTPTAIFEVGVDVFAKKSDAGARSAEVVMKSGGTEVLGTGTALGTSYAWLPGVNQVLDPNTGAAWTHAARLAMEAGAEVSA